MPINGNVSTVAAALAAMASGFGIGGVFIKLGRIAMRNDLLQQKVEMKTEMKKRIRWNDNRNTVPLNYNFILTRVDTRGTTRKLQGVP